MRPGTYPLFMCLVFPIAPPTGHIFLFFICHGSTLGKKTNIIVTLKEKLAKIILGL